MRLTYYKGTIVVQGDYSLPNTRWDSRSSTYRGLALHYREMKDYLKESEIPFEDHVLDLVPCPELDSEVELRDYQQEAFENWLQEKKGIVVMPTGSGKTILALKIIEEINSPAFIIVPTLDLVEQWKEELQKLDVNIGEYTGREKNLKAITVSTYDSAYINAENLGNKFKLLVFDEVHHLPSEGYKQIAELFASPYRLGLTATYKREDGLHSDLPLLVGGIVYEVKPSELSKEYLSEYETRQIKVELTEKEQKEYEEQQQKFKNYLKSSNIQMRGPQDFQKIVMRSGNDPKAREAVLARNRAEKIAYNSKAKLYKIKELLEDQPEQRTIVFTKYNDMAYDISHRFFIPCITHKTPSEERKEILDKFRKGDYSVLVTSQVLDEGVDVPEANMGIIVSGTGSSREFTQRLGRLLRPRPGKKAILYELISKATKEVRTSYRRKKD